MPENTNMTKKKKKIKEKAKKTWRKLRSDNIFLN